MTDMTTTLFNRREASDYLLKRYGLRAKPATLAKYASLGGGPAYRLAGRFPAYDVADLDKWALARVSDLVSSTSEYEPVCNNAQNDKKPDLAPSDICGDAIKDGRPTRKKALTG